MREESEKYWDYNTLKKAPAYRDADFPDSEYKGLRAILFDGAEVKGKKAPVFAYLGIPEGQPPKGGFPGIVLIHGGGTQQLLLRLWRPLSTAFRQIKLREILW